MRDIVKRMRLEAEDEDGVWYEHVAMFKEAADEIERLRDELDKLKSGENVLIPISEDHATAMKKVADFYLLDAALEDGK